MDSVNLCNGSKMFPCNRTTPLHGKQTNPSNNNVFPNNKMIFPNNSRTTLFEKMMQLSYSVSLLSDFVRTS